MLIEQMIKNLKMNGIQMMLLFKILDSDIFGFKQELKLIQENININNKERKARRKVMNLLMVMQMMTKK